MKSFLILLLIVLLQSGEVQITVTLLDHTNQPMVRETLSFANEQQEVLASCITNANGSCTMTLEDVPTDASGLIRGTLITGRGQRPVIFKGKLFEITLTLDETDQLHIPSDAYVTRTPQIAPTAQIEAVGTTPTATVQIEAVGTTPTATVQIEATSTTTTQVLATATATTQIEMTATTAKARNNFNFWFQLSLIIILIIAAMIYIWSSQKQNNL